MKIRLCDFCNKDITNQKFIKCCLSEMENGKQKLIHVGDVCENCWGAYKRGRN